MPLQDDDDRLIQGLINADPTVESKVDFSRPLEPGEKADDAIDYEDIDDDDLADEDDISTSGGGLAKDTDEFWQNGGEVRALGDVDDLLGRDNHVDSGELDDLFGEGAVTSLEEHGGASGTQGTKRAHADTLLGPDDDEKVFDASAKVPRLSDEAGQGVYRNINYSAKETELLMAQNFAMVPAPPENREEALATMWPKFQPDQTLRFMELLPPKRSHYLGKAPLKPPKQVQPIKITLDLSADQEKTFKSTTPPQSRVDNGAERGGVVFFAESTSPVTQASEDDVDADAFDEDEVLGGVTWLDLKALCECWDVPDAPSAESSEPEMVTLKTPSVASDDLFGDDDDEWARDVGAPNPKVRLHLFCRSAAKPSSTEEEARSLGQGRLLRANLRRPLAR